MKLKSNIKAKIETWTFDQMVEYSRHLAAGRRGIFEGFGIWSQRTEQRIAEYNNENYRDCGDLSPLEVQAERNLPDTAYHKSLVALHDDQVIGILVCQWLKDSPPFWRFYQKFLDIHENFRNQGVATGLIKALDKSDFIKGKILEISPDTADGHRYSHKVVERVLKAKDYALISHDYGLLTPPTKFGKYNSQGVLI